jgi:hypothetical protein
LFTQEENGLERSRVEVMTPRPAGNVPSWDPSGPPNKIYTALNNQNTGLI